MDIELQEQKKDRMRRLKSVCKWGLAATFAVGMTSFLVIYNIMNTLSSQTDYPVDYLVNATSYKFADNNTIENASTIDSTSADNTIDSTSTDNTLESSGDTIDSTSADSTLENTGDSIDSTSADNTLENTSSIDISTGIPLTRTPQTFTIRLP